MILQKRNYKVLLSVGTNSKAMHPVVSILDTEAGSSLVSKGFLPAQWNYRIKTSGDPGLVAATKEAMVIQGVILLHVRLGDL